MVWRDDGRVVDWSSPTSMPPKLLYINSWNISQYILRGSPESSWVWSRAWVIVPLWFPSVNHHCLCTTLAQPRCKAGFKSCPHEDPWEFLIESTFCSSGTCNMVDITSPLVPCHQACCLRWILVTVFIVLTRRHLCCNPFVNDFGFEGSFLGTVLRAQMGKEVQNPCLPPADGLFYGPKRSVPVLDE